MRKEVILAITIGFVIGLALTYLLYKSQLGRSADSGILTPLANNSEILSQTTPTPEKSLTIISPIDQSISAEGKINIAGANSPLSWITILGEKGEKVIQANDKGAFQTDLLLISGENEITITVIDQNGEKVSKTLTVVYSTAQI